MTKQRFPEIGEQITQDSIQYKVTNEFMGIYYGRAKYARVEVELDLGKIVYLTEPKKKKAKEKPAVKITREERGQILSDLVEPDSLRDNFKREIMALAKLIRKFPHRDFLLEGFKPAIKVKSLLYWIDRQEVEDMYKLWAVNLSSAVEPVVLEKEKIGVDMVVEKRKVSSILELLS